jgi:hypothetical protein
MHSRWENPSGVFNQNVLVENPEKVLLYVWVKTDLAPNIPVYIPNETYDVITELLFTWSPIWGFGVGVYK